MMRLSEGTSFTLPSNLVYSAEARRESHLSRGFALPIVYCEREELTRPVARSAAFSRESKDVERSPLGACRRHCDEYYETARSREIAH